MALSILDGNQTATTLSTIVTSGQHIPAHTIVSLGAQAVTDISTAVGLLQSAVATQGSIANTAFVKIGGHTGTATTGNIVHVSSVGAMKVDASASTQPISGTVTAGLTGWELLGQRDFFADGSNWIFSSSVIGQYSSLAISFGDGSSGSIQSTYAPVGGQDLAITWMGLNGTNTNIITSGSGIYLAAGIVSSIIIFPSATPTQSQTAYLYGKKNNIVGLTNAQLRGSAVTVGISSVPNGTLTTRFGSVTTANTSFATTAVTNTSRKYLMIQNIASTVITAGIGFTPTTTQGIQLVAGATITYDGNYIPTGAVRILSSVTASNFTVLEA